MTCHDMTCVHVLQEVKLHDSKLTKDLVVVEGYQSYWACSQGKTGYSGASVSSSSNSNSNSSYS